MSSCLDNIQSQLKKQLTSPGTLHHTLDYTATLLNICYPSRCPRCASRESISAFLASRCDGVVIWRRSIQTATVSTATVGKTNQNNLGSMRRPTSMSKKNHFLSHHILIFMTTFLTPKTTHYYTTFLVPHCSLIRSLTQCNGKMPDSWHSYQSVHRRRIGISAP